MQQCVSNCTQREIHLGHLKGPQLCILHPVKQASTVIYVVRVPSACGQHKIQYTKLIMYNYTYNYMYNFICVLSIHYGQ